MRWPKILCFAFVLAFSVAKAQSPTPIVVQAASAGPVTSTSTSTAQSIAVSLVPDAIKLLETIKADNDEVLAKQKAALEKLDELEEAADQLRIFSKRG
jgi:hypothetical protein